MMHMHGKRIRRGAIMLAVLTLAGPGIARVYSPYVETWRDRAVQGAFVSIKPSDALQRCVATQLKVLAASGTVHSEALSPHVTEVDASAMLLGVRIVDQGEKRVLLLVSEPRINDRAIVAIRECA